MQNQIEQFASEYSEGISVAEAEKDKAVAYFGYWGAMTAWYRTNITDPPGAEWGGQVCVRCCDNSSGQAGPFYDVRLIVTKGAGGMVSPFSRSFACPAGFEAAAALHSHPSRGGLASGFDTGTQDWYRFFRPDVWNSRRNGQALRFGIGRDSWAGPEDPEYVGVLPAHENEPAVQLLTPKKNPSHFLKVPPKPISSLYDCKNTD